MDPITPLQQEGGPYYPPYSNKVGPITHLFHFFLNRYQVPLITCSCIFVERQVSNVVKKQYSKNVTSAEQNLYSFDHSYRSYTCANHNKNHVRPLFLQNRCVREKKKQLLFISQKCAYLNVCTCIQLYHPVMRVG